MKKIKNMKKIKTWDDVPPKQKDQLLMAINEFQLKVTFTVENDENRPRWKGSKFLEVYINGDKHIEARKDTDGAFKLY